MTFFTGYLTFVAVAFAVTIGLSFVPAYQTWLLRRIGRRIGIGVPADLDPAFGRLAAARIRASSIGGLVAILLFGGVVVFAVDQQHARVSSLIVDAYGVFAVAVLGSSIGITGAALRAGIRHRDGRPRLARLRVARPTDYMAPLPRRLAYVIVALAATTILLLVVLPSTPSSPSSSTTTVVAAAVLLVVAGGSVVAFPVVARRIIDKGRETTTTDEMVWDDALRAEALRDLLSAPVQTLAFGMFYGVFDSLDGPSAWAVAPAIAGMFCNLVFAFALRDNRDWFLRRLWAGARRRTDDEEAARLSAVTHP